MMPLILVYSFQRKWCDLANWIKIAQAISLSVCHTSFGTECDRELGRGAGSCAPTGHLCIAKIFEIGMRR
jgi:hypothetical protein